MPLIAVTVRQFPTALHVGEVVMCEMQLKNLGAPLSRYRLFLLFPYSFPIVCWPLTHVNDAGTTAAANIKLNTNKPSSVVVSSSQFPDWPGYLFPV